MVASAHRKTAFNLRLVVTARSQPKRQALIKVPTTELLLRHLLLSKRDTDLYARRPCDNKVFWGRGQQKVTSG
jgi:hypothetical protein